MTTTTIQNGARAVFSAYSALRAIVIFLTSPYTQMAEAARDKKLVLAVAKPVLASTDFSGYKEASIETRTIKDSRGRILAQVKLWIYLGERKCYREVTFLNHLLMASVGINRLPFQPLEFAKADTPAAVLEVTVRELETWLRNRTPGTQFGIEAARNAAAKPPPLRVVGVAPVEDSPSPVARSAPKAPAPDSPVPAAIPAASPAVPPMAVAPRENAKQGTPATSEFQRAEPRPDIKAKAEEFVYGLLQSVGMQERTTGARKFKQYCVDILLTEGDSRGMVKRLWGADLERALSESRARLGATVEVCHHGSMPIANAKGGSSYKNSYSMRVIK